MQAALVDRFLKLMPDANRRAFEEGDLTINPKMQFPNVFDYFWNQFGHATEEEIVENTAKLLNPWQPHEGMEVLIDRFDQTQVYTFFARNQMDDKTLITHFLIIIKKTGKYTRAYEDWLNKPDAQKTFANLNEFWRQEHLKMKRANPTAKTYGFGMAATDENTQEDNHLATATFLEQCANTLMTNQKQQQERQQQFEATMAANMAALQSQFQQAAVQQQQAMNTAI